MEGTQKRTASPRSRRSNINLADLRLSPLSVRYTEPPKGPNPLPDEIPEAAFTRNHSSYIQGKSAPTSPGILSRSSSKKNLGAGLRRKNSLYDNDHLQSNSEQEYHYAGVVRSRDGTARVEVGSGQIPKAKSEAALLVQRSKLANQGLPTKKPQSRLRTANHSRSQSKSKIGLDEHWITRTGATASAFLQESKGQSWIASRESTTSLTQLEDTTDDEDEGYEELAAQSANAVRRQAESPRMSRWGSRYGSRTASRRTSRRGSISLTTGIRTPVAGQEGYFDDAARAMAMEPDFVDGDEESDSADDAVLATLTETRSFGLGGLVDRVMNFSLFNVEEKEEATEDEVDKPPETSDEATARIANENRRKREEKERLTNRPPSRDSQHDDKQGEGGWADAAWLLSVASRAIF